VLALVAGATVVLAGLGWMLVRSPGSQPPAEGASVLVRPQAPAAASPTPTPSPTATDSGFAAEPEGVATGRDPFGGTASADAPAPQPPPDGVASAPVVTPTSSPDAAPQTVPPASPQGGVPAAPTTFPVVTATVTHTVSPSVTPTVTMTAPGSAIYVGFYAWNGTRASFRVNARTYSYPVGTTFGPQLTFTSIRSGTPRCAVVRYQPKSYTFTLCPGQIVKLP
jgi:hypothetical protein